MTFKKQFPRIFFDDIPIEAKKDWEEEYLETCYCRFKRTLESINPKPKDKVLEMGCDTGLFSILLKNKFDIDHKAVEIAEDRLEVARSRGIDVVKANIEKERLPFRDNYFDIVFFAEVMEHLSDPLFALSEVKRVVKPTGTVIISTPNAVGLFSRYNHLFGCSPHHPSFLEIQNNRKNQYGFHHFELTINQCRELLEKNGYKIEKLVFSRYNHQRRGVLIKIIERLSLLKPTWSDAMIFTCKALK